MVKVAAIQMSSSHDQVRNLRKAGQYVEAAAKSGAKIACFPELFGHHWFCWERSEAHHLYAEPFGGPFVERVSELAARYRIAVICPFYELSPEGVRFNSTAVIDEHGNRVGLYRKAHVPDIPLWEEQYYFSPGDLGFPVFELAGTTVGVQICWDMFYPEGFRALALKGAKIVFVPTAAAFDTQNRWMTMAASHAMANGIYVVRVNRVGSEAKQDFYGRSFCIGPGGELDTDPLELKEGMLLADCDPEAVVEEQTQWPLIEKRRPELYTELTKY